MLRDRLVCGINDVRIQRRLLSEPELTYKRAFDLAQAMETAERNAQSLLGRGVEPIHIAQPLTEDRSRDSEAGAVQFMKDQAGKARVQRTQESWKPNCFRCGAKHGGQCRFKDAKCHNCGKLGHLAKVCRSKSRLQERNLSEYRPKETHQLQVDEFDSETDTVAEYTLFNVKDSKTQPFRVTVQVNGQDLSLEVDTGATLSLISYETYNRLWIHGSPPPIKHSLVKLRTYTGEKIDVIGEIEVEVSLNNQKFDLSVLVVKGNGPNLLGRLKSIKLDWTQLNQVSSTDALQELLGHYSNLLKQELGCVTETKARINIDPTASPRYCKARTVPYALRERVEGELDRLVTQGVIEPVRYSEWAAPIVPIVKGDGSIRICGDYKVTVNRYAQVDTYPLPPINDLFRTLSGGKLFSKLDLAHAYLQIPLEEHSKVLTTINTQKGLFQYTRLPFGISAVPTIFQRIMEGVLRNLPHVCVYLDDILVTGRCTEEHLTNLKEVFTRLNDVGFRLKRGKCKFLLPSVEYLGHVINSEGLKPSEKKVRAILHAPAPKNASQLRSFLGLVNYYGRFIQSVSAVLAPLYLLLRNQTEWFWGTNQASSFEKVKELLVSSRVLVHFDPDKELIVSSDTSQYGIGAVLSHLMEDGSERPIYYAS